MEPGQSNRHTRDRGGCYSTAGSKWPWNPRHGCCSNHRIWTQREYLPMALTELWRTPSPSSSFLEGVTLQQLPRRVCALSFRHEGAESLMESCEIRFHEVVAFRCTYLPALTVEMIQSAYDKLMDMDTTSWLVEVNAVLVSTGMTAPLRHLRICFDD